MMTDTKSKDIIFDKEALLRRSMDDEELMLQIIQAFIDTMDADIGKLHQVIKDQTGADIKNQAHKIKGGSANAGAMALHFIARDLEMAGKAGDYVVAEQLFADLVAMYKRFKVEVGGYQ